VRLSVDSVALWPFGVRQALGKAVVRATAGL
jgi:hypothetical protein